MQQQTDAKVGEVSVIDMGTSLTPKATCQCSQSGEEKGLTLKSHHQTPDIISHWLSQPGNFVFHCEPKQEIVLLSFLSSDIFLHFGL